MQNMRKYKTIITLTLILCFLTFQITKPRQAYAFAPAVGLAVAAVLAVGTAAGLTYTFDNATGDAIASRLQAFLDDVHPGQTIANYFSARNTAIKEGLMYIGSSLYSRICEFFSWEQSENGVTAGNSVVLSSSDESFRTIDGDLYYLTLLNSKNDLSGSWTTNFPVQKGYYFSAFGTSFHFSLEDHDELSNELIVKYTDLHWLKIYIDGSYVQCYYTSDGGNSYNFNNRILIQGTPVDRYLIFVPCTNAGNSGITAPVFAVANQISSNSSVYETYSARNKNFPWTISDIQSANEIFLISEASTLSLTASDVIAFPDVLEGQSVCVDVGMMTDATADQIADEIIDAAIDGTLSPSISAETWTVDVVATPQDLAQDLDIDLDTTTDIVDDPTVPDTPDDTVEFDTPEHYTVRDLSRFFPFCIPFDLMALLGLLNAEPAPPHFEWRFNPEWLDVDYTVVLDFAQFNEAAAFARKLELLGFCVGLAFATRYLIKG